VKKITRDRVVVFRLSEEEYLSLKRACDSSGARSISDFTRSELLGVLPTYIADGAKSHLDCVQQVDALRRVIGQLIYLLENIAVARKTDDIERPCEIGKCTKN
jgi:hypothetical protein